LRRGKCGCEKGVCGNSSARRRVHDVDKPNDCVPILSLQRGQGKREEKIPGCTHTPCRRCRVHVRSSESDDNASRPRFSRHASVVHSLPRTGANAARKAGHRAVTTVAECLAPASLFNCCHRTITHRVQRRAHMSANSARTRKNLGTSPGAFNLPSLKTRGRRTVHTFGQRGREKFAHESYTDK
jgi:hypothetical protein